MEKVRKILAILMVMLVGYGVFANITHFISIRGTYTYSFDDSVEILSIKKSVIVLNQDIEKLKEMENSSLGKDVLDSYIELLENLNKNLSSYAFMNYKGNMTLTQKDLYQMLYDYGKLNYLNILNICKKLESVNPSLIGTEQNLTKQVYTMMLFSNYMYETFINNYAYTTLKNNSQFMVSTVLSLYEEKLNTIHDVSELVLLTKIESGDTNE